MKQKFAKQKLLDSADGAEDNEGDDDDTNQDWYQHVI